jgi:hypothetical protein
LQLNYDGQTVALPFNFEILKWAAGTRQVMRDAKLPDGVCFYNIYGTSFDTPFDVWYVCELLKELGMLFKVNGGNLSKKLAS